jgi:hypothetical protein
MRRLGSISSRNDTPVHYIIKLNATVHLFYWAANNKTQFSKYEE